MAIKYLPHPPVTAGQSGVSLVSNLAACNEAKPKNPQQRLAKWFTTLSPKDKAKIIKDVSQLVLSRRTRMCNFLEYKDTKVVYRRYASLFFIAGCSSTDNELITLEIVHRYVEQMDKYYGNVCELDIIFNFQKAYFILDELLLAGEMQESSKKNVLRCISQQDSLEDMEIKRSPTLLAPASFVVTVRPFKPHLIHQVPVTYGLHNIHIDENRTLGQGEIPDVAVPALGSTLRTLNGPSDSPKMKYLPLRDFDDVTNALNFDTADCHVIGGCDLYTTKAAGADKKLYKNIENSLESQYASLLSFSASLSTHQATAAASALNLSRASPFGPLSQISSRRTFAYLIATLNASHPDYDFSHILRPADFRREKSIKKVINTLDTTLYNLRPRPSASFLDQAPNWSSTVASTVPSTPHGSEKWNPRMWRLIDKEMQLKECSIYCYSPEEDPYDGEEGAIWSFNYFFFNKAKKRVCYIYLRGLSIIGNSPPQKTPIKTKRPASGTWSIGGESSMKRARYWLGDREGDAEWVGDEDEDVSGQWDEENVEEEEVLDEGDGPRYVALADDTTTGSETLSKDSESESLSKGSESPSKQSESPCNGRGRSEGAACGSSEDFPVLVDT
ncbi:RNA polymerase III-inhibiting protein maf1 [Mycoblastus sanguinarius]|nr:RNA polymerase III-inhibiting protein maf1 [Mycoblastus sanguinarius]